MILFGIDKFGNRVPCEVNLDFIESSQDERYFTPHTTNDTRITVKSISDGGTACPHDFVGRNFNDEQELLALYQDAIDDHMSHCVGMESEV